MRHDGQQRRLLVGAAAVFASVGALLRTTGWVSEELRIPLSTIAGLAAVCCLLGLLRDPTRQRPEPPLLLMDGPTVVRAADRRDNGRIIDTIDDEIMTAMGWLPQHFDDWLVSTRRIDDMPDGLFVITRSDDEQPIGVITLAPGDGPMMFRVGFWLGPMGRGEGHMGRALSLLVDRLATGGFSFVAQTSPDNAGALKACASAGFTQIGSTKHRLPNGDDIDTVIVAKYAGRQHDSTS